MAKIEELLKEEVMNLEKILKILENQQKQNKKIIKKLSKIEDEFVK